MNRQAQLYKKIDKSIIVIVVWVRRSVSAAYDLDARRPDHMLCMEEIPP